MKLTTLSDIIFLDNPYSAKAVLYARIKLLVENPQVFLSGNVLWKCTMHNSYCVKSCICTNNSPWIAWYLMINYSLLELYLLKIKICEQLFTLFPMSAFMLVQSTNLCARNLVFSIPLWMLCSCFSACYCSFLGIMMHFPFIITLSITVRSFLNAQYSIIFCGISFLLCNKPLIIQYFNHHKWSSCNVTHCKSCIDMHFGISVVVCTASIFIFMPGISLSWSSLWFCRNR